MKKLLCSIVVLFLLGNLSAQNIDKQWIFNYIHSEEGRKLKPTAAIAMTIINPTSGTNTKLLTQNRSGNWLK